MANQFIFFCGGSGARAAEAYAYCAAMGLMGADNNVRIVLCDADTENGNVKRALGVLEMYQQIRQGIYNAATGAPHSGDIFCTPITTAVNWDMDCRTHNAAARPQEYKLTDLADQGNPSQWVLNALFSTDEADKRINDVGFHAHPNLGSAIVQAAILREKDIAGQTGSVSPYRSIKNEMRNCLNNGKDVHVFFVGSLFGGTGNSCMPTIASDLRNEMGDFLGDGQNRVIMGACMLLPYFTIPTSLNVDDQYVKNGNLKRNARNALSYYINHNSNIFDVIYPLSLPNSYTQPGLKPYFGGQDQKNPVSLVEWSAAAACRHFVNSDVNVGQNVTLYCGYLEEESDKIVLNDNSFMMPEFGPAFVRWMNFVSFYTLYLHPNIQLAQNRKSSANWYGNYVKGENDVLLDENITKFCLKYYNALYETLGMTLADENARPVNNLVDSAKWDEIKKLMKKNDWKPKDVKAAHHLMKQKGFKLVKKIHQNHCDASRLIKSVSTGHAGYGEFGNLLQIVNSAL